MFGIVRPPGRPPVRTWHGAAERVSRLALVLWVVPMGGAAAAHRVRNPPGVVTTGVGRGEKGRVGVNQEGEKCCSGSAQKACT